LAKFSHLEIEKKNKQKKKRGGGERLRTVFFFFFFFENLAIWRFKNNSVPIVQNKFLGPPQKKKKKVAIF
jgi:hypothetical protein